MKVIIGADNNGYRMKEAIIPVLKERDIEVHDVGVHSEDPVDYPEIADAVATRVAQNEFDRGILICGTGIGMAIAANKIRGIRAAVCHDLYSTQRSRRSNNAQIMTMGSLVIGINEAVELVKVWLDCEFSGGDSARKVDKMMELEYK